MKTQKRYRKILMYHQGNNNKDTGKYWCIIKEKWYIRWPSNISSVKATEIFISFIDDLYKKSSASALQQQWNISSNKGKSNILSIPEISLETFRLTVGTILFQVQWLVFGLSSAYFQAQFVSQKNSVVHQQEFS